MHHSPKQLGNNLSLSLSLWYEQTVPPHAPHCVCSDGMQADQCTTPPSNSKTICRFPCHSGMNKRCHRMLLTVCALMACRMINAPLPQATRKQFVASPVTLV